MSLVNFMTLILKINFSVNELSRGNYLFTVQNTTWEKWENTKLQTMTSIVKLFMMLLLCISSFVVFHSKFHVILMSQ